jgi:putative flippase GtrA
MKKKRIISKDEVMYVMDIDKLKEKYFKEEIIEKISYLFFGGLTTVINIAVYWAFTSLISFNYFISSIIAWIISVIFAFITNKLYVFKSKKSDSKSIIKEGMSFVTFRILTLGLDLGTMFLMVQIIKTNDIFAKIVANVLVIVVNYFASKLIIFRK